MAMPRQVPFWVAIVATVSAFLLTLLFGPGAFWEWRKTTVQLINYSAGVSQFSKICYCQIKSVYGAIDLRLDLRLKARLIS
jgi:hypothetical protein